MGLKSVRCSEWALISYPNRVDFDSALLQSAMSASAEAIGRKSEGQGARRFQGVTFDNSAYRARGRDKKRTYTGVAGARFSGKKR
jgi:hypothetical protein